MESISEIAAFAVECLEQEHLDSYTRLVSDLEHTVGSSKVRKYLAQSGVGLVFLKKAASAAASGDQEQMETHLRDARRYADDDEIAALCEEHRLSLVPLPSPVVLEPRVRLSLAG